MTLTEICAELVMLPVVGDTLNHVAFSLLLQLTVWLLFLSTISIWLDGLMPPCTAWKLSVVGVACSAHASGNADKLTTRITPMHNRFPHNLRA